MGADGRAGTIMTGQPANRNRSPTTRRSLGAAGCRIPRLAGQPITVAATACIDPVLRATRTTYRHAVETRRAVRQPDAHIHRRRRRAWEHSLLPPHVARLHQIWSGGTLLLPSRPSPGVPTYCSGILAAQPCLHPRTAETIHYARSSEVAAPDHPAAPGATGLARPAAPRRAPGAPRPARAPRWPKPADPTPIRHRHRSGAHGAASSGAAAPRRPPRPARRQ